jgi:hypothetical protein
LASGLGLWIDLGWFHRYNHSDSLIPVLVSLYRWTPFYWDQNRVGMLVPLVALPFRHPLDNLLVQGWLVLGAALAVPFLLTRYVLRSPAWPLAGALAAGASVLLSSPFWFFNSTFGQQQYPVGLALGLGALLLIESAAAGPRPAWGRVVAGLVLMLLANWVNAGVGPILIPLAALRPLLCRPNAWPRAAGGRETLLALGVALAGFASCFAHPLLVPSFSDPVGQGLLPARAWPAGWWALARNTWAEAARPHGPGYLALAAAAALLPLFPAARRRAGGPLAAALALAGSAAVYGLFMGTLRWAEQNGFPGRYWVPVVVFLQGALALLVAGPAAALLAGRARAVLTVTAAGALLAAVAAVHGLPSRARARAEVDHITQDVPLPERTAEVLESRATHLVGSYWQVWVSVFHANLVLRERGQENTVWGVAYRAWPTWDEWGRPAPEELRVAALTDGPGPHPEGLPFLRDYFPPLEVVRRRPTLWEYRARETLLLAGRAAPGGSPLVASWGGGFHPAWSFDGQVQYRWCGGRGTLSLTNTGPSPRPLTLRLTLAGATPNPCRLWIDSPLLSDELTLTAALLPYARTLIVPPGRHALQFYCDGPRLPDSPADRPLVFCAGDLRLEEPSAGSRTAGP